MSQDGLLLRQRCTLAESLSSSSATTPFYMHERLLPEVVEVIKEASPNRASRD